MFEMFLHDPGEGLQEAEIVSWRVAIGDQVAVNDIVLEIETAKSLVELPSPFAGVVAELCVAEGAIVPMGTLLMRIADPDDAGVVGGASVASAQEVPVTGPTAVPVAEQVAAPVVEQAAAVAEAQLPPQQAAHQAPQAQEAAPDAEDSAPGAMLVGYGARTANVSRRPRKGHGVVVHGAEHEQVQDSYQLEDPVARRVDEVYPLHPVAAASVGDPLPGPGVGGPAAAASGDPGALAKPSVRRLARELGVDLASVTASGPGGVITETDVARASSGDQEGRREGRVRRIPLRGIRRAMVQSMTASLQVPQAMGWLEADITGTLELLDSLKDRREFAGLRISPLLVLAKAACLAIARHPEINSKIDLARDELAVYDDVNLGIAAATPRGLVVPNVKRANAMNLVELAQALNEMVVTARDGRLTPADSANGTFTITNIGVFGVDGGAPIPTPGESAILCMGTIRRRPWVVGEGDDEVLEIRSVCTISLSFDHRVVDGELASRFLSDIGTILEDPGLAMMF